MQFIINTSQADLDKLGVSAEAFGKAVTKNLSHIELEGGDSIMMQAPEVQVHVSAWSSGSLVDGYKVLG